MHGCGHGRPLVLGAPVAAHEPLRHADARAYAAPVVFVSPDGYRVEEVALRRALNRPARPALRVA